MDNYNSVKQYLRNKSEADLYKVFEDALIFAESIKNNKRLIEKMWQAKVITKLVFGLSQIDILNLICDIGRNKGFKYVNIEHWTVLIYFFFALKKINPSNYSLPNNNSFLTILEIGDKIRIKLMDPGDLNEKVIFNGFTTYYRMLFSIAIFSKGKAIDFDLLSNTPNLDIDKIKGFLKGFDLLVSLNYDHIVESVVGGNVEHLHGEFVRDRIEYMYNQSLGFIYDKRHVSFSDIMIGDYFVFKTTLPVISNLAKAGFNKKVPSKKVESLVQDNSINTFVIFGMSIENDQHVLRDIMLSLYFANERNPKIIYCYFTLKERKQFEEQFKAVITFSKEVSEYARAIEVNFIRTPDVLKEYFEMDNRSVVTDGLK